MDEKVKAIVREAVEQIINEAASDRSIQRSIRVHEEKIHFVPARYRVFGGFLQSLNIKFGNFIEQLLALVVEHDSYVQAHTASGKKVQLTLTDETHALIDRYIMLRRLPDSADQCDEEFEALLTEVFAIEKNTASDEKRAVRQDIDALFRARSGEIVYLEVKYNDDHDTGKFVDINRKFLKTYAGLINYLDISDQSELKPLLYYFNPTKRWGPIYVPSSHIYRGARLFDEYFEMNFNDVDSYLRQIGDDEAIIALFDNLYQKIRYGD